MAVKGEEPVGSMGTDTPLACLSDKPQPLFNYFKQLFAQVTNPPIDPIREEMVMSLTSYIGTERNILDETPQHCHTLKLPHPILTNRDLEKLRRVSQGDFLATTLPMLFRGGGRRQGSASARSTSFAGAPRWPSQSGYTLLILSDRGLDRDYAPIPSLLALAAVHNHLVREETPHAGGADYRIRRAARGDALRAADRLRGERRESLPGARNGGSSVGSGDAEGAGRGRSELHQSHQQGTAEDVLQDGHFHPAELPRRAGLRGHRAEPGRWSSATSPARLRASKAWAWTCSPRKPIRKHRHAFRPMTESDTGAGRGRQLSIPRATANITCSIRRPSPSCSMPCGSRAPRRFRNTPI